MLNQDAVTVNHSGVGSWEVFIKLKQQGNVIFKMLFYVFTVNVIGMNNVWNSVEPLAQIP